MVTGLVTQLTDSLQMGLLILCALTSVGVLAGWLYPSQPSPVVPSGASH
jgi:hypothetical protein